MAIVLLLLAAAGTSHGRAKTDIVKLKNGDVVHGEIKRMEVAILSLSTQSMSTVSIDWEDVVYVISAYEFEVEDENGLLYFGSLDAGDAGQLLVSGVRDAAGVDLPRVVRITPIERSFWARLDGFLAAGFSYTKGSDVTQVNTSLNVKYRVRKYMWELSGDGITTGQRDDPTVTRFDLSIGYARFFRRKDFLLSTLSFQRNDELGIQLREILSSSYGKRLMQTNHGRFLSAGGLALSNEEATDGTRSQSVEVVGTFDYHLFYYSSPKTNLRTSLSIFPSVTQWGRIRAEFSLQFRREIVKDFFWELPSGYVSYDSNPPSTTSESTDWGIVTNLGWSF